MTSLPVCDFRYDVNPGVHQSPSFPKSRGWLLSESEASHQNEGSGSEGSDNTANIVLLGAPFVIYFNVPLKQYIRFHFC